MPPQTQTKDLDVRTPSKGDKITLLTPSRRAPSEPDFLTDPEWERLYNVITNVRDRAIFQVALHAGLRASEVGMLQMRDYQPKATLIPLILSGLKKGAAPHRNTQIRLAAQRRGARTECRCPCNVLRRDRTGPDCGLTEPLRQAPVEYLISWNTVEKPMKNAR